MFARLVSYLPLPQPLNELTLQTAENAKTLTEVEKAAAFVIPIDLFISRTFLHRIF